LGAVVGTKVSRYENATRMPSLKTIWACEIVFGQPAQELFAGNYETIRRAVEARALQLLKALTKDTPTSRIDRRVVLLRSIVESKTTFVAKRN